VWLSGPVRNIAIIVERDRGGAWRQRGWSMVTVRCWAAAR